MTNKEIRQFAAEVNSLLDSKYLGNAFSVLSNAARAIGAGNIVDRIAGAEQAYSYLLKYLVDGIDDPSRDDVYNDLLYEAAQIRDSLIRMMSLPETPTLYFNTLRSVSSHKGESLGQLMDAYRNCSAKLSPFNNPGMYDKNDSIRKETEKTGRDIFNRLWTSFPINNEDYGLVSSFLNDGSVSGQIKSLVVSALTLGLLEYFDRRRVLLLADAYESPDPQISIRALVGLAVSLNKYKDLNLGRDIDNRLLALSENPAWRNDVRQVFVELIRTNDTDRISGKLKDEILPEIQKLGKEVADKLNESAMETDSSYGKDVNPEWESLIKDEKIKKNLKELSELQQEGADVFMATFAGLKQFPFFNDAANWFLPFSVENSVVKDTVEGLSPALASIVDSAPFVCDSDKYSMILSMSMMPPSQRSMMTDQLKSQQGALDEALAMSDKSLHPVDRKALINNYVLCIYRFYKLFRRKGDFYNPFARIINPIDIRIFSGSFDDNEALVSLGEFYLKIGLYDYARHVLMKLDDMSMPDASRYQKLGYCCEKLGDYENASSYYEQADLLEGDNQWNLRHLAAMYRNLDKSHDAIQIYRRLELLQPENIRIASTLGDLYMKDGQYGDAIQQYHKVEYLDSKDKTVVSKLAKAYLLNKDFSAAQKYIDKILSANPTANDYLNAGHLAWAENKLHLAVSYYRKVAADLSIETVTQLIKDDSENLKTLGIDVSSMPMIIDAIIYSLK